MFDGNCSKRLCCYRSAERLLLEDFKNYTFLTNGNVPVPGVDDAVEFQSTTKAMSIMGLGPEDLNGGHHLRILFFIVLGDVF